MQEREKRNRDRDAHNDHDTKEKKSRETMDEIKITCARREKRTATETMQCKV